MHWLAFALVILALLLSIEMATQQRFKSTLSGIFAVHDQTDDFSYCHDCLVRSVGILQIRLVVVNGKNRLYWVEGYGNMTRDFVYKCLSTRYCYTHRNVVQSNYVDLSPNGGRQQSMDVIDPKSTNVAEKICITGRI